LACPAGAAHGAGQVQAALAGFGGANPQTSALVWRLDGAGSGTQVAGFRAESARIPASTMKAVTSAGALLQMGPDFRFQTRVIAGAQTVRRGKALVGPIYLKGSGDPVLATRTYAAGYLAGRATEMGGLARPLRTKGIRLVRGAIVADERVFDSRRMGPGWPSYYRLYASPLSGLATNQNYAGNGRAAYVSSPTVAAAQRLKATLDGFGVAQVGALRAGAAPAGGRVLATATSPRLPVILRAMNLSSDNFIAETLAKDVGAYASGRGTTRVGTSRTRALLAERGIVGAGDRLVDGSGLSRDNRLSATTLVRLFAAADADPEWGAALIGSLARGGEGTLVRRFTSGPATKRVRAKTGYLNGVSAITGRIISRRGARYAFAMLMNTADIGGARATQDRVVTLLASGSEDLAQR
jgi:D-alanyl-D-alanine carboxypeptidase/D-alanyl-D-alanine-endopeptidase (penicillin-binding protein 4)